MIAVRWTLTQWAEKLIALSALKKAQRRNALQDKTLKNESVCLNNTVKYNSVMSKNINANSAGSLCPETINSSVVLIAEQNKREQSSGAAKTTTALFPIGGKKVNAICATNSPLWWVNVCAKRVTNRDYLSLWRI